jgi:hypothetical protein
MISDHIFTGFPGRAADVENNKFHLFISQSSGSYTLGRVPTNAKEVLDNVQFAVPSRGGQVVNVVR